MKTLQISTKDHSILAGLRSRLKSIVEAAEVAEAYLDDHKKWRNAASYIADMKHDIEAAEDQISNLL